MSFPRVCVLCVCVCVCCVCVYVCVCVCALCVLCVCTVCVCVCMCVCVCVCVCVCMCVCVCGCSCTLARSSHGSVLCWVGCVVIARCNRILQMSAAIKARLLALTDEGLEFAKQALAENEEDAYAHKWSGVTSC